MGRAEAPLSRFLEIACPTLDIPASFTYIAESGFVFTVVGDKVCLVRRDAATGAAGTTTVVTEEVAAHSSTDGFTTEGLITNEFELLCTCVTLGYTFRGQEQVLAELGVQVMRSQGTMALLNGSDMARRRRLALATFHRAVPSKAIPCLRERIASRQRQEFIDRVRRDPVGAAAEAMCVDPNHQILQMGINVRLVDDIRNPSAATGIGDHGPETVYATPAAVASAGNLNVGEENRESQALDVPAAERNTNGAAVISGKPSDDAVVQAADPYDTYNWADTTEHLFRPDNPVLNNTARDRFDVISIDNPYDVDRALGYKETEGERTKGMAEPAVYDPIAAIYDIF